MTSRHAEVYNESSEFSKFIRKASEAEKERVFKKVIDASTDYQAELIFRAWLARRECE